MVDFEKLNKERNAHAGRKWCSLCDKYVVNMNEHRATSEHQVRLSTL